MLEIFLIWVCARKIGKIVADKGRSKIGYQLMLVGLWIGGEFIGAIVGAILHANAGGPGVRGVPCMAYVCALIGAAVGAGIAFAIANGLSPIQRDEDFYRDPDDRLDVRRPEYRRGGYDRIRRDDDRPPTGGGDNITERPAEREPDDRIKD
jgi:hypothetical protein